MTTSKLVKETTFSNQVISMLTNNQKLIAENSDSKLEGKLEDNLEKIWKDLYPNLVAPNMLSVQPTKDSPFGGAGYYKYRNLADPENNFLDIHIEKIETTAKQLYLSRDNFEVQYLARELDSIILNNLLELIPKSNTSSMKRKLDIKKELLKYSKLIGAKTRRKSANFILAKPDTYLDLDLVNLVEFKFMSQMYGAGSIKSNSEMCNDTWNFYFDASIPKDKILLGFSPQESLFDTGAIWAPYSLQAYCENSKTKLVIMDSLKLVNPNYYHIINIVK